MVKPRFTNTGLIRTPHYMYYGQFALSLGKESPYILSKFNPLNTDTFHGPLTVRINGVSLYFILHIVPVRWLCRGSKHIETPLYNMTPWIIPVFWHFASSWLYHQVDLITCTVRNISRTSNCGIRVINWFHCQSFYEKKEKRNQTLSLALCSTVSNRTGTSIDKGACKYSNWLDQWQSCNLCTESHV